MDSKIVFVALVLIASFALPTLATFEKDFITPEAITAILKEANVNVMPSEDVINVLTSKTVISNVVLEEALLKNVAQDRIPCGETCYFPPCLSMCLCHNNVCYRNV